MTLDIAKHKNMCTKILKDIFKDASIAPYLAFKGGTAALFFYGLTRFSVDLDFDLLDPTKEEHVFSAVKEILEQYGKLKDIKNKRYVLLYQLAYDGKDDLGENIKVEINKRNFGSRYAIKEHLGIPMKVMIKEDMAANKLMAMLNRIGRANRDIYDVWYMFSNEWPVNKQMIEKTTGMSYKEFLESCIESLSSMSNQRILDGLGLLLTPKQKVWVKSRLLEETIFLLKLAHSNE
jgi:predicted nucleotidyltransferase component of viral defense system